MSQTILSQIIPKLIYATYLLVAYFDAAQGLVLRAYISQHGLHGEIEFSRKNDTSLSVRTNLKPTLQYPDQIWRWAVHEFPVDYSDIRDSRCSDASLGKELFDLTDDLGYLVIPGKDHAEFEIDHSLTGPRGFWGKSLVLRTAEHERVICASIMSTENSHEKSAVARFNSPVGGSLHFRWISTSEETDSYIRADLYHTKAIKYNSDYTEHKWKLFVTDIFDTDRGSHEDNCNVLQLVFDPENHGEGLSVGDLDSRLGLVKVATDGNLKRARTLYKDDVVNILRGDMEVTKRSLYVVIYDSKHSESFLACAKLRTSQPKSAKALIEMDGIRGRVEFTQYSRFDPTWVNFQLGSSDQNYEADLRFVSSVLNYQIDKLPPKVERDASIKSFCNNTGDIYNPTDIDLKSAPPAGMGTQDQYAVGDLLGKYKDRTEYLNHRYLLPGLANELSGAYWDAFLPLHGIDSAMHRALVVKRRNKESLCGTLHQYEYNTDYQTATSNAQVIFRYPLVGRIIFRQPQDQPWEDTTIIVESLIHADGYNVNNTFEHRWAIHENPPGKDYYNWTARCLSAGAMYDPYRIDINARHPEEHCQPGLEGLCRLGDLTTRLGTLSVAGSKRDSARLTRRLFTVQSLPLTGKRSISRKSLVIYDDHGPVARGERMACSVIGGLPRRKGVIRDWFGNGSPVQLRGRIELLQQSEYDVTNIEIQLEGLDDVDSYRIHQVPVQAELEFPCEKSTLYDTFNPFNVSKSQIPPPTEGTADQYELGDLSNKHGLVEGRRSLEKYYNETQVTLFGPYSILGKSLVLHRKSKHGRWACSSIERGYSPSEARELRAVASFYHPAGFARGYIRFTQLIENDGSQSDTLIEVNLKYPGIRDRNMTHGHNWAIYVNPVGVDATVKVQDTRCVAAGYRWNPYFTQLADPLNQELYNRECGPDNPLRCDAGDLSARLGPISVGGDREMFVDSNLPLEGAVTTIGRSVVIMGPERSHLRFACGNIEPDNDIVKYANIMKPPRFVLSQFMDDVRRVLGVPEWMVTVDSRRTRTLHGGACLQLLFHFTGPHASRLELDFTKLLASGRLDSPSISIPGYVDSKRKKTINHRECGVTDPNNKKKNVYHFGRISSGVSSFSVNSRYSKLITFLLLIHMRLIYL